MTTVASRRQVVPADLWPEPVVRSMDPAHFNAVANDPSVRPFLGGEGQIDLTPLLRNPAHVGIATEHGGFVLVNQGEGRYEVHSMFLPEGRGREAVEAMRAASAYLFAATDCVEVVTKAATTNRGAMALALRAGFEPRFEGPVRWTSTDVLWHRFYGLTLERWCVHSQDLERLGAWFHAALEAMQVLHPEHGEDDPVHNRYVGAVALLLRAGNMWKAEAQYNRWAKLTGYAPMRVLSAHPIIIDLDAIVVGITGDAMEILSCQ